MARHFDDSQLVIASHNTGKIHEIADLLLPFAVSVQSAGDLGLPEPEETGSTFAENAILKARASADGSGQAALSIPILAPLGDLVGVTRQTTVMAYQFGDGFTNVFTPTQGYFMAGLALIGVRWERWVRFIWPLMLIWIGTGMVFLLIAHTIQWGPF